MHTNQPNGAGQAIASAPSAGVVRVLTGRKIGDDSILFVFSDDRRVQLSESDTQVLKASLAPHGAFTRAFFRRESVLRVLRRLQALHLVTPNLYATPRGVAIVHYQQQATAE